MPENIKYRGNANGKKADAGMDISDAVDGMWDE
jgi:hypothetical protein